VVERAGRADLVIITSSPLDRWQCPNLELEHFVGLVRGLPRERLILSGAHVTMQPERLLLATQARAAILGEPEGAVDDLAAGGDVEEVAGMAWLEGGRLMTSRARPPLDLTSLPLPAFDLALPGRYFYEPLGDRLALLETARGCPRACAFCLKVMYGPGLRCKEPERVMEETRTVLALGARSIYFMDLDMAARPDRLAEICRGLAGLGPRLRWCCQARADNLDPELLGAMARAGCKLIHLGVESGSEGLRRGVNKGLDLERVAQVVARAEGLGMATACFFLFGLPGERRGDRWRTEVLARRLGCTYGSFHQVTPYPGAPLARGVDASDPFGGAVSADARMARDLRLAYLRFYLRPRALLRLARRAGPTGCRRGLRLLAAYLGW
jgi:radical SAM superfamily enzyme YgiQ (UPF0313 family)